MFIQKQMLSPSPMPGVIISGYELKLHLSVFSLSTFGICISKLLIKMIYQDQRPLPSTGVLKDALNI